MKQELTPLERYYLQKTAKVGDPLEVKSQVLDFPLEKKEEACAFLLEHLYQRKYKNGQSNLLAVRVLLEDPRIAFQPSRALLDNLTLLPITDKEVVKYMAQQGMPALKFGTQHGALRQACIEKNLELIKFLLHASTEPNTVSSSQRLQLSTMLMDLRRTSMTPLSYASPEKALSHLKELNQSHFHVLNELLNTHPAVVLNAQTLKEIVKKTKPSSYLIYLAQRKDVGLPLLVKSCLALSGKSVEQGQACCQYLYDFMPKQVVRLISQHEALYGRLESSYCPTLYAHVQKEVMLRELVGKGKASTKHKM